MRIWYQALTIGFYTRCMSSIRLTPSLAIALCLIPLAVAQVAVSAKDKTLGNAKLLGIGTMLYCSDNDDVFPYQKSVGPLHNALNPYLKSKDSWKTFNPNGGTFLYNPAIAGKRTIDILEVANVPMFYESKAWPDGTRVVTFGDGHAISVSAADWKRAQKYLKVKPTKRKKR